MTEVKEKKTWRLRMTTVTGTEYTLEPEGDTVVLARTRQPNRPSGENLNPSLRIEGKKPEDFLKEYIGLEAVIGRGGVEIFSDEQRKNRLVKTAPLKSVIKEEITIKETPLRIEVISSVSAESPP
ncbi:hypothetical protein KJA15_00810 [Patescibacteria group bacterium]|nr:hypothetical protein [Patescibacteria group bacterium]